MQPRRSFRLLAGALVLAMPLLTSCGFDNATDRVYTPAEGVNDRDGDVDVLAAVVVSEQPGSGTFIATFSHSIDDPEPPVVFEELAGEGDWSDLVIGDLPPVEVPPRAYANLADEGGVAVFGDFTPGNFVSFTLTFDSGQTTTVDVPVVYACEEYTGLDTSAENLALAEPGDVVVEEPYDCRAVLEE